MNKIEGYWQTKSDPRELVDSYKKRFLVILSDIPRYKFHECFQYVGVALDLTLKATRHVSSVFFVLEMRQSTILDDCWKCHQSFTYIV